MRPKHCSIVIGLTTMAVIGFGGSEAIAQWWWPPSMSVAPQWPTPQAQVSITLSGEYPTSCIPRLSAIGIAGYQVYFDVILDYPPGTVCLAVITPWVLTESVGPLSPGTYTVHAMLFDLYLGVVYPYAPIGVFTVYAPGDVNCDGAVDLDDVEPFVLALTDENAYIATYNCDIDLADMNGDGVVNGDDIPLFVDELLNP